MSSFIKADLEGSADEEYQYIRQSLGEKKSLFFNPNSKLDQMMASEAQQELELIRKETLKENRMKKASKHIS